MSSQSGNVLFLILIAVALFAALSYAVTSSSRGGGDSSTSKDTAKANAAALIQYATSLRSVVQRLKISNGCRDDMLDFSNSVYKKLNEAVIDTVNATAPTNGRCNIFAAAGGSASPVIPTATALDPTAVNNLKPGHGGFRIAQFKGIGTDAPSGTVSSNDIYFQQQSINRKTCLAINDLLNITNPSGEPPVANITGAEFPFSSDLVSSGIISTQDGQPAFCHSLSGINIFLFAIVER